MALSVVPVEVRPDWFVVESIFEDNDNNNGTCNLEMFRKIMAGEGDV